MAIAIPATAVSTLTQLNKASAYTSSTSHSTGPLQRARTMARLTETYSMAHKARSKLSREVARPNHVLRLIVGHANLLDFIMDDIQESEVPSSRTTLTSLPPSPPIANSRVNAEASAPDYFDGPVSDDEDNCVDGDSDTEEWECVNDRLNSSTNDNLQNGSRPPLKRMCASTTTPRPALENYHAVSEMSTCDRGTVRGTYIDEDDEDDCYSDDEDLSELALTRTNSRAYSLPPDLDDDLAGSDSDDWESSETGAMPPTPPQNCVQPARVPSRLPEAAIDPPICLSTFYQHSPKSQYESSPKRDEDIEECDELFHASSKSLLVPWKPILPSC